MKSTAAHPAGDGICVEEEQSGNIRVTGAYPKLQSDTESDINNKERVLIIDHSPKNCRASSSTSSCSTLSPKGSPCTTVAVTVDQHIPACLIKPKEQPPKEDILTNGVTPSSTRGVDQRKLTSGKPEETLGDSSEITTIREFTSEQSTSVSGVLRFCKRRILFPYLKLLGVMGLKPLHSTDTNDTCVFMLVLSKLYLITVGLVLVMGYALHFMTCFRRDHGFSYKEDIANPPYSSSLTDPTDFSPHPTSLNVTYPSVHIMHKNEPKWLLENTICRGNVIYIYILPSTLHLLSFVYMVYLYWLNDDEYLHNLMERVFIQAAHANINVFSQKRLIRRLQGLVGIGCCWIIGVTTCGILQVFFNKIYINFWLDADPTVTNAMTALLMFSTLWHDAIQVTVIVSFAIHCHLVSTYTELIRARLMQHSISLSECMKELGELGQILQYLNDDLAPGLAPLLLIDGLYASGTIVHLIQKGHSLSIGDFISFCVVASLWIFIVFFPLIQAAKLSQCCRKLKDMGHEVRIRPFGYQYVPQFDLDSFLLFVSNLNLKVKILKVPITTAVLSIAAIALTVFILLRGYFQ